jgi:large subunit ribosomal protein L6
MSRIGKLPIQVPSGVTITVDESFVTVTGSKGTLKQFTMPGLRFEQADGVFTVKRDSDEAPVRAKHGLMRSLINNMIVGVSTGFEKKLEINGVGYRANMNGTNLKLQLGFSHDVDFVIPAGITASVEQNVITIKGIDKQQVGQIAAEIRELKKPEPYVGERIIRKSGKSGKDK